MAKGVASTVASLVDKAGDLGGLWSLIDKFSKNVPDSVKKALGETLPVLLGLSKKDEGLWVRTQGQLAKRGETDKKDYVGQIDRLLAVMKDFQVRYFHYCLAQAFIDGAEDTINFLAYLAGEVESRGPDLVLEQLLRGRLTVVNPFAKRFADGAKKFEQYVLAPFGVGSAADLLRSNVQDLKRQTQKFDSFSKKWAKLLSFGILR